MLKEECFQTATLLFYEAKYDQALRAINQYIQQKPRSSMAFNNRGLIQLSMGRLDLAKEDMESALQLNHLNYVAYFNLLSVHCKQDNHRSGLLALQGALSCLYLIKGRLLQDKSLLSMAIELSTNNIDAILLLVLLEVRDRNYCQSLVLVQAANSLQQNLGMLQKLGAYVEKLQLQYSEETEDALFDYLIDEGPEHHRLSGRTFRDVELGESELRGCLEERLGEFNSLYGEITRQVGGASYLIAKPAQPQEPDESGDPPKCNSVFRKVGVVARN